MYQDGSGFSRGIFLIVFGLVEFEDDDEGIFIGVVIVGHGYLVVFLVGSPVEWTVIVSVSMVMVLVLVAEDRVFSGGIADLVLLVPGGSDERGYFVIVSGGRHLLGILPVVRMIV